MTKNIKLCILFLFNINFSAMDRKIDVIFKNLSSPYNLVVKLLYGCSLRLFECLLEKNYKDCGKAFVWQWFFPAKSLTFVPEEKAYRRYHLYETHVQQAIKNAVRKAEIMKRVSPIPSATVLPPTSCRPITISAPYRNCWGTAM